MVVQSLPGVRLGGVSFGEPLVQGQKKKKKKEGNHGHNYPSSSEILVSNSLFFLSADSTVTLYSHFKFFKQSTHAKKNLSSVFSYPLYMYISILFFRKQTHTHTRAHTTHTRAHTKSSLGMLLIFFFYGLLPCCLFWC